MSRRLPALRHQFLQFVPDHLEFGVLYISVQYKSMAHLCCCGCGSKVVTPISPTGWTMSFDGQAVTVSPSIGNWNLPCRSHYWISRGRIRWVEDLADHRAFGTSYGDAYRLPGQPPNPSGTRSRAFWKKWFGS